MRSWIFFVFRLATVFSSIDWDHGRRALPGGINESVQEKMHLREITIVCGMTETSPAATQTRPDDAFEKRIHAVDQPVPHVEIKVIDPLTGRVLPRGLPGEQCMRGCNVSITDKERIKAWD